MTAHRVAILISGGGSNMVSLVRAMRAGDWALPVLVVSNRPDVAGLDRAAALNVPTKVVDHRAFHGDRPAFEAELTAALESAQPDVICCAGFMRVLTPAFVGRWQGQVLNIHPSLLPKYPGLDTHARALAAGDTDAGCTVHTLTEELDGGPILGQARVPVLPGDDEVRLAARVLEQEHILYPLVLERFIKGETARIDLAGPDRS